MPIRRTLKPLYPADWSEVSHRIRFVRAGGRCERCGRPHGQMVYALPDGRWYDAQVGHWRGCAGAPVYAPSRNDVIELRLVRVILTTAHLRHDPTRNADSDLAALCSRCHMIHDRPHHRVQRRITLRSRWALADLFDGPYGLLGYPNNG